MPRVPQAPQPFEHTFAWPFSLERGQEFTLTNRTHDMTVLPPNGMLHWSGDDRLLTHASFQIANVAASRPDVLVSLDVCGRVFTASGPWLLDAQRNLLAPVPVRAGDWLRVLAKSLSFDKVISGQVWVRCLFRGMAPY
jgi:hypothetical protein